MSHPDPDAAVESTAAGQEFFYCQVKSGDAGDLAASLLPGGEPVKRLFYRHPATKEPIPRYADITFYKNQQRLILRNCGVVNPERFEDYEERGGYEALRKAVTALSPAEVVEEVKRSGLRGRGGAGFPTWAKWDLCRRQPGEEKYVIGNANESAPGAFIDRSLLEADPHSVVEGLAILGYAVGASRGILSAGRNIPSPLRGRRRPSTGPMSGSISGRTSWARTSALTSSSSKEGGPSFPGKKRPF